MDVVNSQLITMVYNERYKLYSALMIPATRDTQKFHLNEVPLTRINLNSTQMLIHSTVL